MTETELAALEQAALTTPADPAFVAEWARATRDEFARAEQQAMAEFKLWKFVRDDARLQKTAQELTRIRGCLAYLDTLTKGPE
jgi:acyl-CoA reductase-like NAD-dependent aldehyde dehydrogenase